MVFLLGKHFPDTQLVTKTLTSLYGISEFSSSLRSRAPAAVSYKLLFPANAQAQASTSQPAAASKQEHAQRQSASTQAQAQAHAAPLSPQRHSLLGRILARHQIHPTARLNELSDQKMQSLAATLDELNSQNSIENNLRRKVREDIKRLRDMGSYRGRRHAFGLPVRGQKSKGQIMTAKRLNRIERRG